MSAPEVVLTSEERATLLRALDWGVESRNMTYESALKVLKIADDQPRLAAPDAEHEREVAIVKSEHNNEVARRCAVERALADLRGRVEALADDFESEIDWSDGRNNYGDNAAWESAARQIRALLASEPQP